jgi:hypothetical protein
VLITSGSITKLVMCPKCEYRQERKESDIFFVVVCEHLRSNLAQIS